MPNSLSAFLRFHKRAGFWLLAALASLALRASLSPRQIEQGYSRGLFQGVRVAIDLLTAWFPIALAYVVVPLFLWLVGRGVVRSWRRYAGWGWRLASLGVGALGVLGALVALFLWLWGYNYGRVPMEKQLGLSKDDTLSLDYLLGILDTETVALTQLRAAIPGAPADSAALTEQHFPSDMEARLSEGLEAVLARYGYPVAGRVRARLVRPKGIFLRFSSSGLYLPYSGEGHVDAGLITLQHPAVMAHEMAHGYGFGDEGVCSFWAYLTCYEATHPALAYAGRLSYWRSLAAIFKRHRPGEYTAFRAGLPPGMQADLDAVNENLLAYPDFIPEIRYAAYDAYLKAQGISEGMLNYGSVIALVEAWRRKQRR
jgi:hypothetical protein